MFKLFKRNKNIKRVTVVAKGVDLANANVIIKLMKINIGVSDDKQVEMIMIGRHKITAIFMCEVKPIFKDIFSSMDEVCRNNGIAEEVTYEIEE